MGIADVEYAERLAPDFEYACLKAEDGRVFQQPPCLWRQEPIGLIPNVGDLEILFFQRGVGSVLAVWCQIAKDIELRLSEARGYELLRQEPTAAGVVRP